VKDEGCGSVKEYKGEQEFVSAYKFQKSEDLLISPRKDLIDLVTDRDWSESKLSADHRNASRLATRTCTIHGPCVMQM